MVGRIVTQKKKSRLEENMRQNMRRWHSQVWILPKRQKSMRENVLQIARKIGAEVTIYLLEEIEKEVRTGNYDMDMYRGYVEGRQNKRVGLI